MALLQVGSRGPAVEAVQAALNYYLPSKFHLDVDGRFGGQTRAAVVEFQKRHKLSPDGVVGLNTEKVLFACVGLDSRILREHKKSVARASVAFAGPPRGGTFSFAGLPNKVLRAFLLGRLPIPLPPPQITRTALQGQVVAWPSQPTKFELQLGKTTFLSRPLDIQAAVEPKTLSFTPPQFAVEMGVSARWTLLPEQSRTPSIFLKAASTLKIGEDDPKIGSGAGIGLERKGNSVEITFDRSRALVLDPTRASNSDAALETTVQVMFSGSF